MPPGLARYQQILDGKSSAKYLHCRSVQVDDHTQLSFDEKMRLHDDMMSDLKKKIETGGDVRIKRPNLLDLKLSIAKDMLRSCRFCEHRCGADRVSGRKGRCGVLEPRISSAFLHMGEEDVLVPSLTVFFSGCNLRCIYCQNHDISTDPYSGSEVEPRKMADIIEQMVSGDGQRHRFSMKAKNVNWVGGDPTPGLHFILETLCHCSTNIPQVWNSNMYLTEEAMRLLDGVVDVYLTDLKYGNDECGKRLSMVDRYMEVVTRNHLMAYSQAEVIVRHLILPGHVGCCTLPALEWIKDNIPGVLVNIMAQYRPMYLASSFPGMDRYITSDEFDRAVQHARRLGLDLI